MIEFLKSDTVQSTLRLMVFMITVVVCFNLLALPFLLAMALSLTQDLSWVGGYVSALAAMGGASILGKALQKKYEAEESSDYTSKRKEHSYSGGDRHM